jgi:hypothetical protein
MMRAMLIGLSAILTVLTAAPLVSADQRLETRVEIALRPIKADGTTRLYQVEGRTEPLFWDPVFPIPIGDLVEIRALPISGERRIDRAVFRLDGADYADFKSLPPYQVTIDTAGLAEGWHQVEVFCQQESSHPGRASGSVKFLLIRQLQLEDSRSTQKIADLQKTIEKLKTSHLQQIKAWETEKTGREAEQATKISRWQAAVTAEPIAVAPDGIRVVGSLVAGGGTSVGVIPSGKKAAPDVTGGILSLPAIPRPRKIDLKDIGEVVIRGQGQVCLDYQTADGRHLSKLWQVNGQLRLCGVSVPLTITATLGNRRLNRELTEKKPTAVFDFTKEVSR